MRENDSLLLPSALHFVFVGDSGSFMAHCEKAHQLWCFGPYQGMILDLLSGWRNWLGKYLLDIWNLVPLCLMWCIWREHNKCMFEDVDSLGDQLLASFSGYLFD